jgi:hypothetical protein
MPRPKEKPYVNRLQRLAHQLGFAIDTEKIRHYSPDQVWKSDKGKIGFEVEYGKASNKKIVGDAYYLTRFFKIGFILVRNKFGPLRELMYDLGFNEVHMVDADKMEEKIREILKTKRFI